MPEYLSPGVYIEEQDTGPEPIEGVSTSVTGFVGVTQMGPLDTNPPVLVTSFPEYQRTFGTYFTPSFQAPGSPPWNLLPHAVNGFFVNGGQLLYIKRIASASSQPASALSSGVEGGVLTRLASDALITASSAKLLSTRGIQVGTVLTFTQVLNGVTTFSGNLTVTKYNDGPGTVWFVPALPFSFRSQYTTVAAVGTASALAQPAASGSGTAILTSVQGIQADTVLNFTEVVGGVTTNSGPLTVSAVDPATNKVTFAPALSSSFAGTNVTGTTTTLTIAANVGDSSVTATSATEILDGDTITLTQGGTSSGPLLVSSVNTTTGVVQFSPSLTNNFPIGTTVTVEISAALAVDAAIGSTSIIVTSVQGIQVGDAILLKQGATTSGTLTVTSVSPSTNTITFTPSSGLTSNFTATTVIATIDTATTLQSDTTVAATSVKVVSLTGIQAGSVINLEQVSAGVTVNSGPLLVSAVNTATNVVTFSPALTAIFPMAVTTVTVSPPTPFVVAAANGGSWGNNIHVTITNSSRAQAQVQGITDSSPGVHDTVLLNSSANFYAGAIVEFSLGASKVYGKVSNVIGSSIQMTASFPSTSSLNPNSGSVTTARSCEFDVSDSYGNVSETFRGLTLDGTTPYYYGTVVRNGSNLLSIPSSAGSDDTSTNPFTMPVGFDGLDIGMAGGNDGVTPIPSDVIGVDLGPGQRTGIQSLIDASDVSIIGAPGITDQDTQNALIDQCETLKYRFAILDPTPTSTGGAPSMTDIQNQRDLYDTYYAAIYYPRVVVSDPLSGNPLAIPPSGHMAGIYAQTDVTRGVWKAPANIVINGILSLETKLSKGDQDILNPEPNNINALRDFTKQGRGLRVYGARCITSNEEWKYINVRRLFIFLEASLDQGTQWAVFEPNDQQLWNRLIQSVSSFLTTIWQQGGLMGATADQAFFVKCGYDTMSSDDIQNGRLIMLVGIAPVFPAEFVIIRIGQWAGGSSVQEL